MFPQSRGDGQIPRLANAQRAGDLRGNQLRIADSIQRNKVYASWELFEQSAAEFQGQAGLPDTAWTGERHQPYLRFQRQLPGTLHFPVPANQRRALSRKIMRRMGGRRSRL